MLCHAYYSAVVILVQRVVVCGRGSLGAGMHTHAMVGTWAVIHMLEESRVE
jgi:hypothetical protein